MKKKLLLFVLLLVMGSSSVHAQNDSLQLHVKGVYDYSYGSAYAVRLVDQDTSSWSLIMIIGECEANGIMRSMYSEGFSRPLTYDLIGSILESSSLELRHVIITKLEDGTFYANLVIKDGSKELRLDARPSDCMNIALESDVPIYVNKKVWDENKEKGLFDD